MEAFYRDPGGETEIFAQDCVSGMNELPEGLVDLMVTSPPYAIGKDYELDQSFGQYLKLLSDFLEAGYHVTKKGGYAVIIFADYYMFAGQFSRVQPMTYLYHLISERIGWVHQCTRVWQKDYATLSDPYTISGNLPKLEAEWIMTLRKPGGGKEKVREQVLHGRQIWSTAGIRQSTATLKHHTAAYPEALVKYALEVYTDINDHVLDPFGGSGTTCAVSKRMGRRSTMFEISPEYLQVAKTRLEQQVFDFDHIQQPKQANFTNDKTVMPDEF